MQTMAFKAFVISLGLLLSANVRAGEQENKFAEYRVPVSIDSAKEAHTETFRLPQQETDLFLSLYEKAATELAVCGSFEGKARNPLLRRFLAISVKKSPMGCQLQIWEYDAWKHDCLLTQEDAQSLSVIWFERRKGSGLGGWGAAETLIFKNACETEPGN